MWTQRVTRACPKRPVSQDTAQQRGPSPPPESPVATRRSYSPRQQTRHRFAVGCDTRGALARSVPHLSARSSDGLQGPSRCERSTRSGHGHGHGHGSSWAADGRCYTIAGSAAGPRSQHSGAVCGGWAVCVALEKGLVLPPSDCRNRLRAMTAPGQPLPPRSPPAAGRAGPGTRPPAAARSARSHRTPGHPRPGPRGAGSSGTDGTGARCSRCAGGGNRCGW